MGNNYFHLMHTYEKGDYLIAGKMNIKDFKNMLIYIQAKFDDISNYKHLDNKMLVKILIEMYGFKLLKKNLNFELRINLLIYKESYHYINIYDNWESNNYLVEEKSMARLHYRNGMEKIMLNITREMF